MKLGDRKEDSEKQPISLDLPTACIKPLGLTNRKGNFGESIFQALIELKLGWIAIKHPRLDGAGIDREFRLMDATIDTQIKTSTMALDESWTFEVFGTGKSLDMKLYSKQNSYLVLIGLHCTKLVFPKFLSHSIHPDPLEIQKTILMISGEKVIAHFKEKTTGQITINYKKLKKGEYKWLRNTQNPFKVFAKEYKRQTGTEMPLPPN